MVGWQESFFAVEDRGIDVAGVVGVAGLAGDEVYSNGVAERRVSIADEIRVGEERDFEFVAKSIAGGRKSRNSGAWKWGNRRS